MEILKRVKIGKNISGYIVSVYGNQFLMDKESVFEHKDDVTNATFTGTDFRGKDGDKSVRL